MTGDGNSFQQTGGVLTSAEEDFGDVRPYL